MLKLLPDIKKLIDFFTKLLTWYHMWFVQLFSLPDKTYKGQQEQSNKETLVLTLGNYQRKTMQTKNF